MTLTCSMCGTALRLAETSGRPRRYCSGACRQKAYRQRQAPTLPREMTLRPRWVRHDLRKRPLTVHGWLASVNRPETWSTYRAARESTVGAGLGFVLGRGIGCIDLDHCINDAGELEPWAAEIVDRYRPRALWVERSMSGRGVHVFLPMKERGGLRLRRDGEYTEVYSRGRYIAVTGDPI